MEDIKCDSYYKLKRTAVNSEEGKGCFQPTPGLNRKNKGKMCNIFVNDKTNNLLE